MKQFVKPLVEGLAVGIVFVSITMLFQIPTYMSVIIGILAAIGGFRNSIKMDAEKKSKKSAPRTENSSDEKGDKDA